MSLGDRPTPRSCKIGLRNYYSAPYREAEYCDERVCLSVGLHVCVLSVHDHIFGTTRPIFTNFFVHVTYGLRSVHLWRRSNMLCTSGFVDDIFAHKPKLFDVAARTIKLSQMLGIVIYNKF